MPTSRRFSFDDFYDEVSAFDLDYDKPGRQTGPKYLDDDGHFTLVRAAGRKQKRLKLNNFVAKIIEVRVVHIGGHNRITFRIVGRLDDGTDLPEITVPAELFGKLEWVMTLWGEKPQIYPGLDAHEHVCKAIQTLSSPKHTVGYANTGWVLQDYEWVYLTNGYSIGPDGAIKGINVMFDHPIFNRIELPEPPTREIATRLGLNLSTFLSAAPSELTIPLLAAVALAPLGPVTPLDFSLFLGFKTGSFESAIASVTQAFFGEHFRGKTLLNADTTSCALEVLADSSKEHPMGAGDYLQEGLVYKVQNRKRDAERLLHTQPIGKNRSGKGQNSTYGAMYHPRELTPTKSGELSSRASQRANMILLELHAGDVDASALRSIQNAAMEGELASFMAGYIQYLARQMDFIMDTFGRYREDLRLSYTCHGRHPQIPGRLAGLHAALDILGDYVKTLRLPAILTEKQIREAMERVGNRQNNFDSANDF